MYVWHRVALSVALQVPRYSLLLKELVKVSLEGNERTKMEKALEKVQPIIGRQPKWSRF
jgi:hypothetical protein